jgi:hypothetical protein
MARNHKQINKPLKLNTMTHTQTQQKETYNGWANYATWRIALEWFDDYNPDKYETNPSELAGILQSYVEQTLEEVTSKENQIVLDYALAFTSEVNWYEIAHHLIEVEEGCI